MPMHCQVMVRDESGKTYSYLDGNGGRVIEYDTQFCSNDPVYRCDSGFKFCKFHKKSHGTRGKDGHIHDFKHLKKVRG